MSAPQKFAVLQPFLAEWQGERAEQARLAAVTQWITKAQRAGKIASEPSCERVDPAVVNGEPLTFTFTDSEGNDVDLPPMSAWRVEGLVQINPA